MKKFLKFVVAVFFVCSTAHAERLDWNLISPVPQPTCPNYPDPSCYYYGEGPFSNPFQQNQPQSIIQYIRSQFDNSTGSFKFEAALYDNAAIPGNVLPTSFWFVLNHGPMPFHIGMAPIFYFDGNDLNNPKLTVYGYNNGHDLFDRSFEDGNRDVAGIQTPDRICSSENNDCGDWLKSLTVQDISGVGRITSFEINASIILQHVPMYNNGGTPPAPWLRPTASDAPRIIGPTAGIWFHWSSSRTYTYDANGYIASVDEAGIPDQPLVAGYYDAADRPINIPPVCVTNFANPTVRPGQTISYYITASDADGKIHQSGSGVPADVGFTITKDPAHVYNIGLTAPCPNSLSSPTFTIRTNFMDSSGSRISCEQVITIVNEVPVCSLGTSGPLSCGGAITTVPVSVVATDGDGDSFTSKYSVSCDAGTASINEIGGVANVALTGPGAGQNTSCTVKLSVADSCGSSSCSLPLEVPACQLDCTGTPNGPAVVDQCGVCNGNNACLDCAGVPNGGAVADRCGVCGGNGDSCLDCQNINISGTIADADGLALQANSFARRVARSLGRSTGRTAQFAALRRQIEKASSAAYAQAWTAIWGIPTQISQCGNTTFCVSVSLAEPLGVYNKAVDSLFTLANKGISKKNAFGTRQRRSLQKQLKSLRSVAAAVKSDLPASQSICSGS